MDRRIIVFAAVLTAILTASAVIVIADPGESDAATLNYDVGDTISNQGFGFGDSWTGSIPGITFGVVQSGGSTTTYTVSFSADPSAGGSVSTSSITVVSGTTYSLSGTSLLFSDGQSVSASSSTGYYHSGWSSTSGTITSNKSIRAYFTLNQYTVTFGVSPSAGGSVDLRSSTAYYGDTYSTSGNTLTIYNRGVEGFTATATPASGYRFDHWSSTSGTITSNKTITAYFTAAPSSYTCYLYYNANGGFNAPATQSYTGTSTSSHSFTISSQEPFRNDYTFLGWSTSSSATTATYHGGDTISVGYNSSKTLYAVWQEDTPSYTVTISKSPTSGGTVSRSSLTVTSGTTFSTSGSTLTIGSTTVTATPASGYVFDYWYPSSGTISSSRTITAYFAAITDSYSWDVGDQITNFPILTVGGSVTLSSGSAPAGTTITRSYLPSPTNTTSFTLSGTPTTTGTTILKFSDGSVIQITINPSGTTTYRTLSFAASPSAGGSVSTSSVSVRDGSTYTVSGNTVTINDQGNQIVVTASAASGYEFSSWNRSGTHTISSDLSFTASFTATTVYYTVSFGVYPSGTGSVYPTSLTVEANTPYTVSADRKTLTVGTTTISATPASGYSFNTWSATTSGTITQNESFTANFALTTYTVTIDRNPSQGGSVSTSSVSVTPGTSVSASGATLTIGSNTITATANANYHFSGWSGIPQSGTITEPVTISAVFAQEYSLAVVASPQVGGTVSQATVPVIIGSTYSTSGDTLTVTTQGTVVATVTATPNGGYAFTGWSPSSGTISTNTPSPVTANFTQALQVDYDVDDSVNAILYSAQGSLTVSGTAPPGTTVTADHYNIPATSQTPTMAWTDITIQGTPTTVGTYMMSVSDGTYIEITINPSGTTTHYTVSFAVSPSGSGTLSTQSLSVRSGSTWEVVGDTVYVQQPGEVSQLYSTATANPGYDFTAWDYSGTGTVSSAMTFTAQFTLIPVYHTVSFYTYPQNAGTLTPSSMSVLHGTPYTLSLDGKTLTVGSTEIQVIAASGYAFQGWGLTTTSGTILDDESWPANFTSATHTVTIVAEPSNGGTVSQSSVVVNHGTPYSAYGDYPYAGYLEMGNITVTATPAINYTFQGWSHAGSGEIISDMTFTAYFSLEQYSFWVMADPSVGGTITPNGQQLVAADSRYTTSGNTLTVDGITFTAEPTMGFRFDHWGSESGVVTRNMYVTAYFIGTEEHIVEFNVDPEEGGRVSHAYLQLPHYATFTSSGNVVTFTAGGDTYEVTATPAEGYTFHHWEPSSGIVNRNETVTAVFDRDFSVVVEYNRNAKIYVDGNEIVRNTTFTVNQDNRHEIECVPNQGYRFAFYQYTDMEGQEVQTNENPTQLPLSNTHFAAMVVQEGDVTVTFASAGHGTVSPSTLTIPAGSRFAREGDSLVLISDPSVTATAQPDSGYVLRAWSNNANQYIISNTTITAYFTYDMGNAPWWANGYANNKATIVFDYPQTTSNLNHYMQIPLLEYTRLAEDSTPQYFIDSGYILSIETGYNKRIYVSVTLDGVEMYSASYDPGVWQRYALILDTENGTLSYQGISSMARNPMSEFNFMDYTPIFTNVIADWSSVEDNLAFARVYHKDVGSGTNHPHFQIGNTATFLNTYGVVMIDPILNIYDQFPAYENLRLNMYSFALYGDSITINNRTFEMDGSQITIRYDKVGGRNVISPTGAEVFTAPLTNVYVTWTNIGSADPDARQCSITFVDRNQTFDAGSFSLGDLTISGEGMWYFTTALWEPYDTVKKTYTMDWNSPFNLSGDGFLLLFIALLVIVLVIMNIIWKPTVLDYAIVFGAGLISLITLGTL